MNLQDFQKLLIKKDELSFVFLEDFIPSSSANRPGNLINPKLITIHNTANSSVGADALAHAKYLRSRVAVKARVSWHYTVDDSHVVQHLPVNEAAWHTGVNIGNHSSIGIEICENLGIDFDRALKNAQILVAWLVLEHKISVKMIVPHKFWSGKNCPHLLLNPLSNWDNFILQVKRLISIFHRVVKK